MQINFKAKKLKEANNYVDLLRPPKIANIKREKKKTKPLIKRILNFLFK
ncbi:MAG: Unknown protein [uncultured Sulfurovum sp.]|uniref:Uncharacterized protein n=1 Tax=uncultured Sulfurovum sp. TaxID=269237 RepID=A0A6S6TCQ0_9BACT|nr:MAG: Unknown protein [uncultured Sulfurovum sp.]